MEENFRTVASYFALMLESIVVLTVTLGSFEALYKILVEGWLKPAPPRERRGVWVRFASWILLALEFALGADIIRTAIAPTWDDIGKLGAIAAIRTGLGFFLGKDLETLEKQEVEKAGFPRSAQH